MDARTEQFRKRLDDLGAEFTEGRGEFEVVREFGRPSEEYEHLRDGISLVDMSDRELLVFEGPEAIPWLQGLVTSDLMALEEPGSGHQSCILNANGQMLSLLHLLHVPNLLLADSEASTIQRVRSHLKAQIINEDVELIDRTSETTQFGLFGEQSAAVLDDVGDWETSPNSLTGRDGTWGQISDVEVIVQRHPDTGESGYRLAFPTERSLFVWNRLLGASDRVEPVGMDAYETARIEAGIPRYGKELDDSTIPLEAHLDDTISFNKGCYLGQEIIVRLRDLGAPAKLLRTLVLNGGAAPSVGADIEHDGRTVGEVRSSIWSPLIDQPIALGYLRRKHNEIGTKVEVEGREATLRPLGEPLNRLRDGGNAREAV